MSRKEFAIIHFIIPFLIWLFSAIMIFLNLDNSYLDLLMHFLVWFFWVIIWRTLWQLFSYKVSTIALYPFYFEFILLFNILSLKNIDMDILWEKYKK